MEGTSPPVAAGTFRHPGMHAAASALMCASPISTCFFCFLSTHRCAHFPRTPPSLVCDAQTTEQTFTGLYKGTRCVVGWMDVGKCFSVLRCFYTWASRRVVLFLHQPCLSSGLRRACLFTTRSPLLLCFLISPSVSKRRQAGHKMANYPSVSASDG